MVSRLWRFSQLRFLALMIEGVEPVKSSQIRFKNINLLINNIVL